MQASQSCAKAPGLGGPRVRMRVRRAGRWRVRLRVRGAGAGVCDLGHGRGGSPASPKGGGEGACGGAQLSIDLGTMSNVHGRRLPPWRSKIKWMCRLCMNLPVLAVRLHHAHVAANVVIFMLHLLLDPCHLHEHILLCTTCNCLAVVAWHCLSMLLL